MVVEAKKITTADRVWWRWLKMRHFVRYDLWWHIAWKLPRRLVWQAAIRMWAEAASGNVHPDDVTMHEAIHQWEKRTDASGR